MTSRTLTDADKDKVVMLRDQHNLPFRSIAERFSTHIQTVSDAYRERKRSLGVPVPAKRVIRYD